MEEIIRNDETVFARKEKLLELYIVPNVNPLLTLFNTHII